MTPSMTAATSPARWLRGALPVAALLAIVLSGVRMGAAPSPTPALDWLFSGEVANTTRIGNTLYVAGGFTAAGPSSGTLSQFLQLSPTSGAPLAGLPAVNDWVRVVAPDGAGGFYIAGRFTNIGSAGLTFGGVPSLDRTAHVLADGSVDAAFSVPFGGDVREMLRAGPSLVVSGRLYINAGTTARVLLAVDPITGALSPWVPSLPGNVSGLTTANGVLFVLTWDGLNARRLSAFDATTGAPLWTSAVLASASPVVSGGDAIATVGGRVIVGLDRLYSLAPATGAIDPAWGGPSGAADTWTTALAVSGSTIYVAGRFSTFHGQARANLAAVDGTTGAVLPWSPQATAEFSNMGVSPSGSVFVAGAGLPRQFRVNGESRTANVFEIAASGAVTTFESRAHFAASALHVSATGTLVFGAFTVPLTGGIAREALIGFDLGTGAVQPNTPTVTRSGAIPPVASAFSLGPKLYVSGFFDAVNGLPRANLAAVDTATNTVLPWPATGVPNTASILLAHGGWIYVHPNPNDLLAPLRRIDATTGVLDPVWQTSAPLGGAVKLLVGNGQLYAARISSLSGPSRADLGIPDPVTGDLRTLIGLPATDVSRSTNPFAVDGDTLYLINQAYVGPSLVGTLRAFELRTGRAVSAPSATGALNGVAVADGRVFVNGASFSVGGTGRSALAEIARPNTLTPWDSGGWDLSFRGVTGVVAHGDSLVAYGLRLGGIYNRVAAFPLLGATAPSNLRAQEAGVNTVFT